MANQENRYNPSSDYSPTGMSLTKSLIGASVMGFIVWS